MALLRPGGSAPPASARSCLCSFLPLPPARAASAPTSALGRSDNLALAARHTRANPPASGLKERSAAASVGWRSEAEPARAPTT